MRQSRQSKGKVRASSVQRWLKPGVGSLCVVQGWVERCSAGLHVCSWWLGWLRAGARGAVVQVMRSAVSVLQKGRNDSVLPNGGGRLWALKDVTGMGIWCVAAGLQCKGWLTGHTMLCLHRTTRQHPASLTLLDGEEA